MMFNVDGVPGAAVRRRIERSDRSDERDETRNSVHLLHMAASVLELARLSSRYFSPNKRTAFSFRISGRTSSLILICWKSASQRSGVSTG